MNSKPTVIFFSVKKPQQKVFLLSKIAKDHFDKKEPLVFFAPDPIVAEFIDDLLWKFPEESFTPHGIDESITILQTLTTGSSFLHLFNLSLEPLKDLSPYKKIYELDDDTSAEKKAISEKKFKFYREKDLQILQF